MKPFHVFFLLLVVCQADDAVLFENLDVANDLLTSASSKSLNFESLESFKRPTFTHGKHVYKHEKAKVFRLFEGFHKLLDDVWENTATVEWNNERRHVSHEMIEMRDGVRLSTIIIRPTLEENDKRATLLSRSPYGPTSDQIATLFMATNGFVAVIQDQRGTFLSEGNFTMWQKDGYDGYDTMQWIAKQPWSNGKVFSAGVSADGCGALTQVIDNPPWLKGQFIMLASANAHETIYPGGTYREGLVTGWMTAMSIFTKGHSLTYTLPNILKHEAFSDWYKTVEADRYYNKVSWPTVHLAAWYDIFLGHHIRAFDGLSTLSHPSVRRNHTLFVTPYGHCELGNIDRPHISLHESKGWINSFGFAMEQFSNHLDGKYHQITKRINFFVQGPYEDDGRKKTFGNFWVSVDDWPKAKTTKLYLSNKNKLKYEEEGKTLKDIIESGDHEYTYNPHNTERTMGGNNLILILLGHKCGPQDHTRIERRRDVVTFTTEKALTKPMAITGRIFAELYVSSNRDDTDFVVSLNDVYPNGRYKSLQVRYGIQRMRWRDGAEEPAPAMEAEKVYKIRIDMWPTSYIFNPGHKIRFTVASSNSPYYLKNPNIHEWVRFQKPEMGVHAKNTVHFSEEYPSHVELPVVDMDALQPNVQF